MNLYARGTALMFVLGHAISTHRSGDDTTAARITLMALRAQVAPATPIDGYSIAPSGGTQSAQTVAELLALLAKPLECDASVTGRVLVTKCVPAAHQDTLKASPFATFLRQRMALAGCGQQATPSILLKTQYESLRVSVGALEAWMRDYSVAHVLSENGKDEARALPPGVCLELRIGGPPKAWLKVSPDGKGRTRSG